MRDAAIRPGSLCVEIGPGPQGLTRNILEAPEVEKLIAFEVDKRVKPILQVSEARHINKSLLKKSTKDASM